jgi:6,7-dimethyl-8-ribityllumazine synthase
VSRSPARPAEPAASGPPRYAACVGRFYEDLARRLVEGATRVFVEAGGSVDVHEVPGAFELPLAAKYCAESGRYAGVVCLGAVILTVDNMEQALARTGGGKRHQGEDAARAVVRMADMRRALS